MIVYLIIIFLLTSSDTNASLLACKFIFWIGLYSDLPKYSKAFRSILNSLVKLPAEVMRVLKPGGLYLFIEHVAAEGIITSFLLSEIKKNDFCICYWCPSSSKYFACKMKMAHFLESHRGYLIPCNNF